MSQFEATPQELLRVLRQLRQINWRGGQRAVAEGCTPSETMLLFGLRRHEEINKQGMKVSELSKFLRVSSPTVTQAVNVLEARGLLTRGADPQDGRIVRLGLTEAGRHQTELAEEAMMESLNGFIEHLGKERSKVLIELMDEMHRYYREGGNVPR